MTKTPLDITFDELVDASRAASLRAQREAKAAGLDVKGLVAPDKTTVVTLGAHMCKWPIGDPASDSFVFCGRRTSEDSSYCAEHSRVAYNPARRPDETPRRRRRPESGSRRA